MVKRLGLVLVVVFLLFGITNSSQGSSSISVSAFQIISEYRENEIAADLKYKDKQLTVTGKVKSIVKRNNAINIDIDAYPFFGVVDCEFPNNLANQIAKLQKGQQIEVEGICNGLGFWRVNVVMKNCKLK